MNNKSYINSSGRKVLEYFLPDSIMICLPFIITQDKIVTRNMPYMLLEKKVSENHVTAIRLLDFNDKEGIVSLNLQELMGERTYTLSWNMDYTGEIWLWTLVDYQTLITL